MTDVCTLLTVYTVYVQINAAAFISFSSFWGMDWWRMRPMFCVFSNKRRGVYLNVYGICYSNHSYCHCLTKILQNSFQIAREMFLELWNTKILRFVIFNSSVFIVFSVFWWRHCMAMYYVLCHVSICSAVRLLFGFYKSVYLFQCLAWFRFV